MIRVFRAASAAVLMAGSLAAQVPEARVAFDVADVRVSPRADWVKSVSHAMQGGFLFADRYELHRATMLDMIRIAYDVDASKVYGGPSWLDYDRYEVVAKAKPGTRPEALRAMLRTLLEERFQLVAKPETRQIAGLALGRGKREWKPRPASGASGGGCTTQAAISGSELLTLTLRCLAITMDNFARLLQQNFAGRLGNLPVGNATGMDGAWEFELPYPARAARGSSPDPGLVDALDKLGMKLEATAVAVPVLEVERVNENPSPSSAGIEAMLPPPPPDEFEVASVKLPCEGDRSMAPRFEPGGRVTAICTSLLILIRNAWHLPLFQNPEGAPKWLTDNTTSHNISIVAKAPAGVAPDPQRNPQARYLIDAMLRKLLMDRFKLAVHFEERPMEAYTLTAPKPKLTKADPTARTGCTRENQQLRPGVEVTKLTCRNMTMTQFAEQIQAYDATIPYPVEDGTSLTGAWDFTITYDPSASLNARFPEVMGRGRASASGEAAEPAGSLSFAAAFEKQLGLKLESRKRPEPVLVIDHIEEKPTGN